MACGGDATAVCGVPLMRAAVGPVMAGSLVAGAAVVGVAAGRESPPEQAASKAVRRSNRAGQENERRRCRTRRRRRSLSGRDDPWVAPTMPVAGVIGWVTLIH